MGVGVGLGGSGMVVVVMVVSQTDRLSCSLLVTLRLSCPHSIKPTHNAWNHGLPSGVLYASC